MLKLNVNQEKELTFEVEIGGIQSELVDGYLRMTIDKIQYGFPAKIGSKSISVDLPPLRSVTARGLKEGEEIDVKLEVIADGNYLVAWEDTFRLINPLTVEAKIMNHDFEERPQPKLKTKLVQEGTAGEKKQGVRVEKVEAEEIIAENNVNDEDVLTEKIVQKLAEKLSGTMNLAKEEKVIEEKVEEEIEEPIIEDVKPKPSKSKKISPKDVLNMTKEGVYAYMERAGTSNPTVQDIVYEQACVAAKSEKPVDVLKQVVKILKKK
jgi:Rps23 Pro-64 3,4-dihydroxylase Tpa1-like proline 4-hydroxylase